MLRHNQNQSMFMLKTRRTQRYVVVFLPNVINTFVGVYIGALTYKSIRTSNNSKSRNLVQTTNALLFIYHVMNYNTRCKYFFINQLFLFFQNKLNVFWYT